MGLFKPIWMTENRAKEGKAIAAVNRMTDQGQLIEVAYAAPLAQVACAAIERIDDEDALCKIAMPDGAVSFQARGAAFAKVRDREKLLVLMNEYREDHIKQNPYGGRIPLNAVESAYDRLDDPPFEWMMLMGSKKAELDLSASVSTMTYPADRDKLLRVAREKNGTVAGQAVRALPYEQERDVLRELAANGKGMARSAALAMLRLPADRDVVDAILSDENAGKILAQRAAKLLPDDDPALDERCCPHCGGIGTVFRTGGYDGGADLYYSAYKCSACNHESRQFDFIGSATDFSISLRELRDQ